MVLCKDFGNTATACGLLPGGAVKLLALHNVHAVQVRTATLSEAGEKSETEVVISMHNHDSHHHEGTNLLVRCTVAIAYSIKYLVYPYTFHTSDEVPASLGGMLSSRLYIWDSQAMLPIPTASGSS